MSASYSPDPIEFFREALAEGGVRAALRFLNARSPHRFTSIYRFDGSTLHNLYLYDRANPEFGLFPDAPLGESYCSIINETASTFATHDSLNDERVEGHPKRELVLSYCGIPLVREDGTLFGTLCHFDFVPHAIAAEEVEFLEAVAPYILRELVRPGCDQARRAPAPSGASLI
ncbi:MAG: GAF domain-containing protein [Acidobacteria bacterium]|nr:GAF domain-containing protein [Acidobacteriota bacterium]